MHSNRDAGHIIDKFSLALTLMREAFEDARAGAMFMPSVDLAAEVDGAQQVMNAAAAVQAVRVAQCAAREQEQDGAGAWVEVEHELGYVGEFAADCFGSDAGAGSGRGRAQGRYLRGTGCQAAGDLGCDERAEPGWPAAATGQLWATGQLGARVPAPHWVTWTRWRGWTTSASAWPTRTR